MQLDIENLQVRGINVALTLSVLILEVLIAERSHTTGFEARLHEYLIRTCVQCQPDLILNATIRL